MSQLTPFPVNTFGLQNFTILSEGSFEPGSIYTTLASANIPLIPMDAGYVEPDAPDYISPLGTPVYGSLTLGETDILKGETHTYTGIDGNVYTFDSVHLSLAIIIVNMKKNIVKSRVTGRPRGTIKEYIALDDYDVTIHGLFNKPTGVAPKNEMAALYQMAKAEIAIPVTSYFLNQFGIYHIVIESVEIPQEQGRYSSQAFTINAVSDYQEDEMLP